MKSHTKVGGVQRAKCPAERDILGIELRRWIDRVIVPILVRQYLREKALNPKPTNR